MNFSVDFYYTSHGVRSRRTIQGSREVNLHGANSEFAIQQYIQTKYPNGNIEINRINWR